jgi:thiol:disulfide interchange protein DsbD
MKKFTRSIVAVAALFAALAPAHALKKGGHVTAALVSESKSVQPGTPFWVGVQLTMQPHWHTYWKNAGESGEPTSIAWQLPAGFTAGPMQWPAPRKISVPPVLSYGYEDSVLFLTKITPPPSFSNSQPVVIKAHVDWLECADVCIPGSADVALTLPVTLANPKMDMGWQEKFSQTRFLWPLDNSDWHFTAEATPTGYLLKATAPPGVAKVPDATYFSEDPLTIAYADEQKFRSTPDGFTLSLVRSESSTGTATALNGVLITSQGWRGDGSEQALSLHVPISPPTGGSAHRLWKALLFALIGGLILNLMPCVLPILSIKILGFVQQSHGHRSHSVAQGLTFAAGVIVSFWALAGTLLFLRAGGEKLGWGFHLQSPLFVTALISLFFILGLSMFGIFEIGTSLVQLGGVAPKSRSPWAGSFFSGVLATAVATPCTAPFMGSALGYALTQPAVASMAVFTMLAVGMALPYVILSCSPALLRYVPKPGPWMETLKHVMAFFLMATVLWLAWVLEVQRGGDALICVFSGLLIQSVGAWIWGRWNTPARSRGVQRASLITALLLMIGGFIVAAQAGGVAPSSATARAAASSAKIQWLPYSAAKVAELRAQGKNVFVDFTASWCLTCQVNERVVLDDAEVVRAIEKSNIVPLRADWTNRDEQITSALESFERNGVPFYVIYPADEKAHPRPLPEILSKSIVLQAIRELSSTGGKK